MNMHSYGMHINPKRLHFIQKEIKLKIKTTFTPTGNATDLYCVKIIILEDVME